MQPLRVELRPAQQRLVDPAPPRFHVSMSHTLAERMRARAAQEDRSVASLIRQAVRAYLDA